jgi:hypothetical protein
VSVLRIEQERAAARQAIAEGRERTHRLDHDFFDHRLVMARHAVGVLANDHRAFLLAIGHGDVDVEVTLTQGVGTQRRTLWGGADTAYTSMDRIVVKLPPPTLRTPLRHFVVEVRGMLHHQTGHVRFTVPLPELWERGVHGLAGTPDEWLKPKELQLVWDCVEDQRMEAAVVRATPRIANYFVPMVLAHVLAESTVVGYMNAFQRQTVDQLAPWLALAGRSYMPDDVRSGARDDFDAAGATFGVTSSQWFDLVASYMSATDEADMLRALVAAHRFLERLIGDVARHDRPEAPGMNAMTLLQVKEAMAAKIANPSEKHQPMKESHGNEPSDSATSPTEPQTAGTASSPQADAELIERLASSVEVDEIMARIGARANDGLVDHLSSEQSAPMPEYLVAQARQLSWAIADALEVYRNQTSPMWARHQEQGYLDPLAFRTRAPGERTYRREPQMWENQGFGVHVSFLADRSGSMAMDMPALSQTLWAVKTACDRLDIPSTMVLWSQSRFTVRVMEDDDTPVLYHSIGGTYPIDALNDLELHVTDDGLHHLVIIFTDGAWDGPSSLAQWKHPERTFVMIGLDCERSIVNKEADVVIPISSIDQLGQVVKRVLTDHVERSE